MGIIDEGAEITQEYKETAATELRSGATAEVPANNPKSSSVFYGERPSCVALLVLVSAMMTILFLALTI